MTSQDSVRAFRTAPTTAITLALTFALGGLAGCNAKTGDALLGTATTVTDTLSSQTAASNFSQTKSFDGDFTPEAVAANPDSYQLVTVNALGITELAHRIAANGGNSTWISQSGFSVSYQDGILIATRGLIGEDVMAGNAPGLAGVLRSGGGTVNRAMEALNSLNEIETMTFICTVTRAGSEVINLGVREVTALRLNENCVGASVIFDNIYWLDDDGSIVASRQYVSPTVAYLRSNRL